jgi:putative copper export protein
VVALPALPDGLYRLGFGVRDREDLHEVRGRTSFSIGDHALAQPSAPPAPRPQPLEAAARWLFAAGLAVLVGVVIVRMRWAETPVARPQRLVGMTVFALVAVVAGRVGVIVARALDLHVGLAQGLSTVARTSDVARLPVVIAAAACAVPLLTPHRFPALDAPVLVSRSLSVRVAMGWLAALWLALIASWGDHAALRGVVEPAVAAAKAIHLIGLGAWIGVLVVVLVANTGTRAARQALVSVSRIAVLGAVVTVGSGLVLAARMVVSLTGLLATAFGQLLALKLALVAGAAALGIAHRRLRRTRIAIVEAALLGAVVLLGASMATAGPATDDAYLAPPAPSPATAVSAEAAGLLARARAVPAQPGPNGVVIDVVATRRPALAAVSSITLRAETPAGPRSWTVAPDDRGSVVVSGVDLVDGANAVTISVSRIGLPVTTMELSLSTQAPRYHHRPIVSSAPIELPLQMLALTCGLAAMALIVTWPRAHLAVRAPLRRRSRAR